MTVVTRGRRRYWQWAGGVVLAAASLWLLFLPANPVYLTSDKKIERYLLKHTPLNSPQDEVLTWLRSNRTPGRLDVLHIEPNSDYPLTRVGGESFIHVAVAEYRLVFASDVEAFYVFDASGRLADLRVRTTTDAL